jgi:hypothetical protein
MSEVRIYESPTPYEAARIHAAAIYCSDGRVGEQIDEFLHQRLREGLGVRGFLAHTAGARIRFEPV